MPEFEDVGEVGVKEMFHAVKMLLVLNTDRIIPQRKISWPN